MLLINARELTDLQWLILDGLIPEPYAISSSPTYSPSSLATRLAANENTGFFLGLVKPQPGDISIVV
jgi:hypothetical protein